MSIPVPSPSLTRAPHRHDRTEDTDAGASSTTTSTATEKKDKFITGRPDEQFSSEAAEERQELFNDIAPVYDQLNDLLSLGLHRVWKRAAVKWTRVGPGDAAIDVCCGSGDIAIKLADSVGPTGRVVGLDFAAAQLKVAAGKESQHPGYRDGKLAPITWVQGDALKLPYGNGEFDGATIGYGLRNVSDIPTALSELCRVLRPGGVASIEGGARDQGGARDASATCVSPASSPGSIVPLRLAPYGGGSGGISYASSSHTYASLTVDSAVAMAEELRA